MKDEIVIAEALGGQVRIHAMRSAEMVEEARKAHNLWPTSCAALGRTMTVGALMASDLKREDEHVMIRISGSGPVGAIRVEADGAGNVRGFPDNPSVYLSRPDGHLDVGKAVGRDGTLTVSKDMWLKEPFSGTVALVSGEIGDDFAYYYAVSEQTPSVVAVGVLVNTDCSVRTAGGMIIQLLPGASEETVSSVEQTAARMRPMTEYMSTSMTVEELIRELFPDAVILGHRDARWHCSCSKERFAESMAALSEKDLDDMINEDHGAEVVCQYCSRKYLYSEDELRAVREIRKRVADRKRAD